MQTQVQTLQKPDDVLLLALETLSQGGIILFPTESVYGLGVDSQNSPAIEKLYELKGRPKEKPFQWLVHDLSTVKCGSTKWNESIEKLAAAFWPGPLTLVLPSKMGESIGWRIPKHDWLLRLLKELNRPLISTSANPSGTPTPNEFSKALEPFQDKIELALDGGPPNLGIASTVIAFETDKFRILREGAISKSKILEIVG